MSKYKVCVYAICKNEEKFINRWMDSVESADLVVVLDTGSTDNSIELLKKRGAKVYTDKIDPWRFDVARNTALSHVPSDYDICVSNDIDEVFEPGWREKLETVWGEKTTRARYLFTWSFNIDGTPNKQFFMEKIHSRNNFKWIHPVHEILEYTGSETEERVFVNGLVLNHYPDNNKPRSQYLPLLEMSENENPTDPQTVFWLGREYMYHNKYYECIDMLKKYLNLDNALWDEERCAAMRYIAASYDKLNNKAEAWKWYFRAVAESVDHREAYLEFSNFAYREQDFTLLYFLSTKAISINTVTSSYLMDPLCYKERLYDHAAISAYRLGLYQKALEYATLALQFNKDDQRLINNFKLIKEKCGSDV